MTGRMSMDQAKTIKRKRELAQELGALNLVLDIWLFHVPIAMFDFPEDVQQFEKAVLGRSSRSQGQSTAKGAAVEEDDFEKDKETTSEDEDEAGSVPRRRPVSAISPCPFTRVHYDLQKDSD